MVNEVKLSSGPHGDLFLEWDYEYTNSISEITMGRGSIKFQEYCLPHLLYSLGKNCDNLKFIDERIKNEILKQEKVAFANCNCDEVAEEVEEKIKHNTMFWKGQYENGEKVGEYPLESGRHRLEFFPIIQLLNERNIEPISLNYSGWAPHSGQYPHETHIFKSGEDVYVAQYWRKEEMVKMNMENTKRIVSDLTSMFEGKISGSLKTLISK